MSDEIVRRLFSSKSRSALTESLKHLNEKDEDEEEITPEEEDITLEDDPAMDDNPEDEFEVPEDEPSVGGRGPLFNDDPMDDTSDEDGEVPEPEMQDTEEDPDAENVNPLDNPYAVKFQLGDQVVLSYANGTKSEMKGMIEGYDKLGFYRIKWADGLTTNGITDIALLDLVNTNAATNEGKCICGSKKRIREGKNIICDRCGRLLYESEDPLTKADKERPEGKKLVKSMASSVSTANRPTIDESIKKAFSKKRLKEDEGVDPFSSLYSLEGEFWTRLPEIVADIEDLGYDVLEANAEYIIIGATDDEDEDHELQIFLGGTDRTMTLDFNRVRKV